MLLQLIMLFLVLFICYLAVPSGTNISVSLFSSVLQFLLFFSIVLLTQVFIVAIIFIYLYIIKNVLIWICYCYFVVGPSMV